MRVESSENKTNNPDKYIIIIDIDG